MADRAIPAEFDLSRCLPRFSKVVVSRDALNPSSLRALRTEFSQDRNYTVTSVPAAPVPLLQACRRLSPCVLVVRRSFVTERGPEHVAEMLGLGGPVRILLVCLSLDPIAVGAFTGLGYTGFITEDASPETVTRAVDAQLDGRLWLDPDMWIEMLKFVPSPTGNQLTAREQQIVRLSAEGLDTRAMAETLSVGVTTVRSHLANIRMKTGRCPSRNRGGGGSPVEVGASRPAPSTLRLGHLPCASGHDSG